MQKCQIGLTKVHSILSQKQVMNYPLYVDQRFAPAGIKKAENWKGFKIEGPLDFSITGILAALSKTLAENKIPLFCVSTFDTDFILVESEYYEQAKKALAIENTIK